jgi:hypothetical protein
MEWHDGDGRLFGNVTAMDRVMAIQLRWLSRWQRDGNEHTTVTAMNEWRQQRWLAWRWMARRWTAWRWTARGLGDEQLDVKTTGMDVVTAMRRRWKRDSDCNEWLGNGWRNGNSNGWLGDGWLGNGRLGNGLRKGLAMNGVTATRWRWNDLMAMDNSTGMAMNGLAMDGSAMDGTMAWRWTALQQCGGDGHRDGDRDVDGSATATATVMNGLVMDGLAMDGARARLWLAWRQRDSDGRLDATQRRRRDVTAIDGSMATAMNNSATDGLAMDGAMAWQWTAWRRRDCDGHFDGNATLL